MMTTQNPHWVLSWTKTMNQWQQPPLADGGTKEKNSKEKNTNKKGKDNEGKKKKKKNDCLHCKKLGCKRPHLNTSHDKCFWNKATKDGVPA